MKKKPLPQPPKQKAAGKICVRKEKDEDSLLSKGKTSTSTWCSSNAIHKAMITSGKKVTHVTPGL
jgi:hypothetical protein